MAVPREGYHDFFLQIPDELWEALKADAQKNRRSATGHLLWMLQERFPDAVPEPAPKVRKKK
jgi:hypothetical protein